MTHYNERSTLSSLRYYGVRITWYVHNAFVDESFRFMYMYSFAEILPPSHTDTSDVFLVED